MKISLIVPVYNEAAHLQAFFEQLDALVLGPGLEKELVIVDDFSTDGSRKIIEGFSFKSAVQKILSEKNGGKGAALRKGIEAATGEVILVQDADFEYEMRDLPMLIRPVVEGSADIVYGSRFKSTHQVHRTFHYLINRLLTSMSNLFSGLYLSDMETCYKIMRAEILRNIVLESNRFGFEPEVTAKIAMLKVRVCEYPISYFPRNYMEGKKINWKDGVAALFHILRFNLFRSPKNSFKPGLPDRYKVNGRQWL